METEARERLSEEQTLRSEIFSARDRLETAFEKKIDGFKERDIERRIPGAGSMPGIIGEELRIGGVLYSDLLVIRTSQSAHEHSTRTHEQRIVSHSKLGGGRSLVQFDTTYIGEPDEPYEIDEANQVRARIILEDNGKIYEGRAAIERIELSMSELFLPQE